METGLAKGREPPDWYKAEPPLTPVSSFFLAAFWSLSSCRQVGFSQGPIPWNHIRDYAEFVGLDRENSFALEVVIRAMDNAYLEHLAARQEQDARMKAAKAPEKTN